MAGLVTRSQPRTRSTLGWRPCGCGSTSPTTAPTSTAGRPSRGCARCRATLEAALATVLRLPSGGGLRRAAPTPACTPAARSSTSTSRRATRVGRRRARCCAGSTASSPPDVRVRRVVAAPEGFDARFSAVWRRYAYRVADGPDARRPADPRPRARLAAAARPRRDERRPRPCCVGHHDFASFCKQREGATTIRTLLDLSWDARRRRRRRRAPSGPTRSATAWCGRWSAACSRSARAAGRGVGRRGPARAAARPGGHRRARARADARGGRLPAPTTSWPRRPTAGRRGRTRVSDDHYFSADPTVPFTREPFTCEVWGHELAWSAARGSSPRAASTSARRCCSARPSRRRRARCSTSAAATA